MSAPLVLSLFPGADLLGRAFELEGCCVVRGPDVLFGHDFDDWTPPPAGAFDGIIAGPPCQPHSLARRGAPARHRDYLPDCFALVARLRPAWAVIENVPNALNEHPAPAGWGGGMNYPGGKGSCFRHLINLMPPHDVYIETHLGGGNVLERKRPAARSIGIDIDPEVITAWRERNALTHPCVARLTVVNGDAAGFLRRYQFTGRELVYSDPPYLHETRSRADIYRFEYTRAQHIELLAVLAALPCAVMVSGYDSELYRCTLEHRHGWRRHEFMAHTRGGMRREVVWFNFEPPAELHDPRYVGDNYRERERIKRKRDRWRRRFAAMTPGERQTILEALLQLSPTSAALRDPLAVCDGAGLQGERQ